jgi:hypothetical protein
MMTSKGIDEQVLPLLHRCNRMLPHNLRRSTPGTTELASERRGIRRASWVFHPKTEPRLGTSQPGMY